MLSLVARALACLGMTVVMFVIEWRLALIIIGSLPLLWLPILTDDSGLAEVPR